MSGTTALKRAAAISYGLGQPPELSDTGVPILRATNIQRGEIRPQGLIYAAIEDLPLDRAPLLRAGEILVVRSGAYTGDSALVTEDWAGSAPGYDLRLTPYPSAEPRFLAYTLLSSRALGEMNLLSGRAAQPHLNAEELGEVSVTLPTVPEQRAIADYLDTETARIDALIVKKRRMIELLKEATMGGIEEIVWSGKHPTTPLKRLVPTSRKIMYGIVLPGPNVDDGALLVKGGDVKPGGLDPHLLARTAFEIEARYERSRIRSGDLLFAIRGGVGDVEIAPGGVHGANITQDVARSSPSPGIEGRWLLYSLRSPTAQRDVARRVTGATIRGINIEELERVQVPVPPATIQWELAARLDALVARSDGIQKRLVSQIELLVEHRQALITAAVTGALDVSKAA